MSEFQLESEMKKENIASDLLGSHPRVEASAPGYCDNGMLRHVNNTKTSIENIILLFWISHNSH